MIVKGKLSYCKKEEKVFDNRSTGEKLFISLSEVELTDEQMDELKEAFKDSGKKFTPEWVKNFEGYVNVSSKYDIPAKDPNGEEHSSVLKMIADGFPYIKAPVKLALNVKEGAVYPVSIVFTGEGNPYNPFAEFDNEEED